MKRVFLGGTCNDSQWRDKLIPLLQIKSFNPVVSDWNEEAQQREIDERETCDFCLYVITPRMISSYAVAEAVDDSNKRPEKTIFCVLRVDGSSHFDARQMKHWDQVSKMVERNGASCFGGLEDVAAFLNQ